MSIEIVTICIEGRPWEYRLPTEALTTSDVLKAMISTDMIEGQTKRITLHDDDPFAVRMFVDLSLLLYNNKQFYNGEPIDVSDDKNCKVSADDIPNKMFAIRKLTDEEITCCCKFWDKYQVSPHLLSFLQSSVEKYPVRMDSFVCMDSMFDIKWSTGTYSSMVNQFVFTDTKSAVINYVEDLNTESIKKLLVEAIDVIKFKNRNEKYIGEEQENLEKELNEAKEKIAELEKQISELPPAKKKRAK